MTEDKGPKLNFSIEEILRDRKIFSLFLKSAEIFAYKKELINEIGQLKLNIKPLVNKNINTTSSEASLKKHLPLFLENDEVQTLGEKYNCNTFDGA
ncbi:hypothetical protein [Rickettsia endosymbiont of Cantharis rufa]|uniref:hypothetical protein n=1 Tax=Rickettsia endosymbiont of Cantharis rufa TaxID=3066248 RepID=UPI0031335254